MKKNVIIDLVTENRKIQDTFKKRLNEGFFDKIKGIFNDSEEFLELLKQFGLNKNLILKNSDGTIDVKGNFWVDGTKEWMDADKKGLALAVNKILDRGNLHLSNIKGQPTPFKLERWPRICSNILIDNCDLVSFEGFSIKLEGNNRIEVSQCDNLKSLKGIPSSLKQFSFGIGEFKNFEDFGDYKPMIISIPGTSKMAQEALKLNNNNVSSAEESLQKEHGIKKVSIIIKK